MVQITKDDIASKLRDRAEISLAEARSEVTWLFDTISDALRSGNEIRVHGFGTFKTAQRAARVGRNPQTGEAVQVPARRVVRFTPSTILRQALASKSSRTGAAKKTAAKKSAKKTARR